MCGALLMIQKWQCPDSDLHSALATREAQSQASGMKETEGTIPHLMADQNKSSFFMLCASLKTCLLFSAVNPEQSQCFA